jgi:esterase/lipase superfamily enzyme
MAYSWPSGQKLLGYLGDVEKAQHSARYLTLLTRFLSKYTDAQQIDIMAHSAGTRVLARSLADISLFSGILETDPGRQGKIESFKLGDVIFTSGDMSRNLMNVYLDYGIADISKKIAIYSSGQDEVLAFSNWLWADERIGDYKININDLPPGGQEYLAAHPNLEIIDATGTPGSTINYGHGFFLGNPWVSSDILLSTVLDLTPEERGLIRDDSGLGWTFPKDYRSESILEKIMIRMPKLQ